MEFLHDVYVNWFEGEENGYNVFEFTAWKKTDIVESLDTVVLLKVSSELFDYIENDMLDIPQGLLDKVHNKSIARNDIEAAKLDYCFIITDGKGILAVDTRGYNIPIRKSRLIPRQEQMVYDRLEIMSLDFSLPRKYKRKKEFSIMSPPPNVMIGLTRREKQLKQILFMGLDDAYSNESLGWMKYLYSEWDIKNYINVKGLEIEELFTKFVAEVSKGWSEQHHTLCKLITYHQPFYKKLYEMEMA